MATVTPNFNWPVPTSTDLVKDGATAIEALGDSIDASLVDLKGGTTGQVLAKQTNTDMDFAWVAQDDSNAIQNSIVDAKGDLIAATAADTPARLAVGTNGQVLTADSTAATGLAWATPSGGSNTYYAGKNRFINGDFGVNQRNFTSTTTDGDYTFDRWKCALASGTVTFSAQTFTPGAAPVAGYEGKNFLRSLVSGQTTQGQFAFIAQRIEDVRTFAGQTVTVSFWAKAASGTPKIGITRQQNFGTGGSPSATVETSAGLVSAITTSWARYSVSFSVPSISGKTIGTTANTSYLSIWLVTSAGTDYTSLMGAVGLQNNTIDIWGVQIEAGSTATDFVTASGNSIQGELAMCQRYFANLVAPTADYGIVISMFQAASSSTAKGGIQFPVPMRVSASITLANANNFTLQNSSYTPIGGSSFTYATANTTACRIDMSVASGLVAGNATALSGNTSSLLIQASAEL